MFTKTKNKIKNPNNKWEMNKLKTRRQRQRTKQCKPKQIMWEMNTIKTINMSFWRANIWCATSQPLTQHVSIVRNDI
jgi:hypothetical protein